MELFQTDPCVVAVQVVVFLLQLILFSASPWAVLSFLWATPSWGSWIQAFEWRLQTVGIKGERERERETLPLPFLPLSLQRKDVALADFTFQSQRIMRRKEKVVICMLWRPLPAQQGGSIRGKTSFIWDLAGRSPLSGCTARPSAPSPSEKMLFPSNPSYDTQLTFVKTTGPLVFVS